MSQSDLVRYLRQKPFEPFRIVVRDGSSYEVRRPEMVIAAPTSVVVGAPDPTQPGAPSDFDLVSMRHIVKLELLPVSTKGNGASPS